MKTIEEYEIECKDHTATQNFRTQVSDAIRKSVSPDYYFTLLRFDAAVNVYRSTLIVFIDNEQREDALSSVLLFYARLHSVAVTFIDSKNRGA